MKLLSLLIFFTLSFTSLVAQKPIINKKDLIDIDDFEPVFVSYRDADRDGLGNPRQHKVTDHVPSGYVRNADDCDDTNASVGRSKTFYRDADGDGYGNPKNKRTSCTKPSGYVSNSADCDDTKAKMNGSTAWYFDRDGDGWGSKELAYMGCRIDEETLLFKNDKLKKADPFEQIINADASIDELLAAVSNNNDYDDSTRNITNIAPKWYYKDADGDGYGNASVKVYYSNRPKGYVTNSSDCNDNNRAIHPNTIWYKDQDGDGWGNPNQKSRSCNKPNGFVSNSSDYNDSTRYITNIAPKWFFRDADGDGYGNASVKVYYSNRPKGYVTNSSDCNDNNRAIHPNTIWYKDQDGDGYGDISQKSRSCSKPTGYVANSSDCNDNNRAIHPNTIWFKDQDSDGWGDASSVKTQCTTPTGYVSSSGDQCPKLAGNENGCPPLGKQAGLTDENYVYTVTPQESVRASVDLLTKKHQAAVTYYDGLGRPKQTVAVGVTPSGKDLVSHIDYDEFGRQHRDYLPVPASGSKGSFRDDAEAQTLSYYNHPAFDNTQNPYTERIYEASPLNRVLEVGAPGNKWKADPDSDADKTIKTDYGANGWDDLVRWFEVDFEAGNTQKPILKDKGVYPAGQLYKNTTKDENWRHYTYSQDSNKTETYTDKQGQVILKRAFSNRSWHDTYYVYDDYGNLTFVIPPEVQTYASVWQQGDYKYMSLSNYEGLFTTEMKTGGKGGAAYLNSWNKSVSLYFYTYNLDNLTPKNGSHFDLSPIGVDLPAGSLSGWTYYTTADGTYTRKPISGYLIGNRVSVSGLPKVPVKQIYFNLSRVIGELRNDKPISTIQDQLQTMMYHYRYDHRNRLVEKKIPGKDWEYIAYDTQDRPVLTADAEMRKANQALKTEYDAFDRVTKTGLVTGVSGSSHSAFKASINKPIATLYTQNFYDRYRFDKKGLTLPNNAVTGTQTQGLQTGSRVRVLNTERVEGYITTLLGYDKKGRLIYSGTHNPAIDATTQQTHTLDFIGRTTQTKTVETKNGNTLTKVDDFAYDHAGRLIDHDLTLNGQQEDLVHNTYDELGQLAQKTVGGGLQTIDYDYNIRGWLRHINNPDALGDDLFGFELDYGSLYNGNIQNTYWKTANDNIKRRYYYYYDGLNRLNSATHYAPGSYWGAYRTWYNYDRNGNIKRLSRRGAQNVGIDYLTYAYNGNQLQAVTDSYKHSEGFYDGNTYGFDYIYDANGNLTQDKNKGITMQYNHLNLPTLISQGTHYRGLRYIYDATGVKHKKVYAGQHVPQQTTEYTPTAVYKNNALEMVFTPEGYAQPTAGGFDFVYQYKDHLGNNRLSYADSNGNGKIDTPSSTAVTLWKDDFEDKSKANGDYDGSGNSWGWPITDIVSNKAKSGSKAGHISLDGLPDGWKNRACHSNEWVTIDIDKPTLFRYSAWVYAEHELYRTRMYLFMKTNDEQGYGTEIIEHLEYQKGKWVFMQKTVLVQPEIDKLNIRIDADGWGQRGGNAWFDDLKIEQLDLSQNEIVSETNYYPFGLAHKGYNEVSTSSNLGENWKYQGQERTPEMDLNIDEWKYRVSDPAIGRFWQIDPLAEDYYHNGTYNFSENRVVDGFELEGLEYVSIHHYPNGAVSQTEYYKMSNEQINRLGGTTASLHNSAAYGPSGKGVVHHYYNSAGQVTDTYNEIQQNDFSSIMGRHGLYSGQGSITHDGINDSKNYDFNQQPIDYADAIAKRHDKDYAAAAPDNYLGFLEDTRTLQADLDMVKRIDDFINPLKSVKGVDTPFRTSSSTEMMGAMIGQRAVIQSLATYKQWKVDNNLTGNKYYNISFYRDRFSKAHPSSAFILNQVVNGTK